jgi:hypothetical protein
MNENDVQTLMRIFSLRYDIRCVKQLNKCSPEYRAMKAAARRGLVDSHGIDVVKEALRRLAAAREARRLQRAFDLIDSFWQRVQELRAVGCDWKMVL